MNNALPRKEKRRFLINSFFFVLFCFVFQTVVRRWYFKWSPEDETATTADSPVKPLTIRYGLETSWEVRRTNPVGRWLRIEPQSLTRGESLSLGRG